MKNHGRGDVLPAMRDVLVLDSRDSFTWNIAQAFEEIGASVDVCAADDANAAAILASDARPRLVCIGPGPRGPTPHLIAIARELVGTVPVLGVCLGMQVLVRAFGGTVARATAPVHGKRDAIEHDGAGVFASLPSPLWVMRYHSLVAVDVPAPFDVVARDRHGQPMALRDRARRVDAVQFHPESIGTAGGLVMLANAARSAGIAVRDVVKRRGGVPEAGAVGPEFPEALYRRSESEEVVS